MPLASDEYANSPAAKLAGAPSLLEVFIFTVEPGAVYVPASTTCLSRTLVAFHKAVSGS